MEKDRIRVYRLRVRVNLLGMEAEDGAQRPLQQTELVGREHRKRLFTEAPAIESARLIHENEAILPEIAPGRDVNTQCSGGRMCSSR